MKRFLFVVSMALCLCLILGCAESTSKRISRLQGLEEGVSSPNTIEELKDAINKYEERVEDIIQAQTKTGIWYKMLASRYLDNKMYKEALEAFQKSIEYYPANQNLYYYIGVCAGYLAQSELDYDADGVNSKKQNYLLLAESAYLRAIELQPDYARALYGLGVLYSFEFDDGIRAIPYLETLLTIEKKHTDGMFVLARCYYQTYDFEKSVDMYDRIISTTTSDEKKKEAEANKKIVLDALYAQ